MNHKHFFRSVLLLASLAPLSLAGTIACRGEVSARPAAMYQAATPGERDATLSPEDLVKLLKLAKKDQTLIFNVGPHLLYSQAHIPGAEYFAPGSNSQFGAALRARVKDLPHTRFIVIYCGCCPWSRCPNIHPAFEELHSLGFTNVKMLYIADNFGADWVDKGYPTAKGE